MNKTINDPFLYNVPTLDVHGETTDTVVFVVNDFINDNYKLRNNKILIIHGKGSGKLKAAVWQTLKNNKQVIKQAIYNLNDGCTIVDIK